MLNWKPDGTAKCGPFKLEVCQSWDRRQRKLLYWYCRATLRDYNYPLEPRGQSVRTWGTKHLAKVAAERRVRSMAKNVLIALKEL